MIRLIVAFSFLTLQCIAQDEEVFKVTKPKNGTEVGSSDTLPGSSVYRFAAPVSAPPDFTGDIRAMKRQIRAKERWAPAWVYWGEYKLHGYVDSVSRQTLLSDPVIKIRYRSPRLLNYNIDSFKMEFSCNNKTVSMNSYNVHLTTEMKKYLSELQQGCIICLKYVRCSKRTKRSHGRFGTGPYFIYINE